MFFVNLLCWKSGGVSRKEVHQSLESEEHLKLYQQKCCWFFFLRISILKDQKEQQNQHLEKLHRNSDELKEQAVALGEKLDNTSEKHLELLRR